MKKLNLPSILIGVFCAAGISLASLAILGLYVYFSNNTIFNFSIAVILIIITSIITGGWLSGHRAKQGGLINGASTGVIYATILLVLQAKLFPVLFTSGDIIVQGMSFSLMAAIGGVIGVNTPQLGRKGTRSRAYIN